MAELPLCTDEPRVAIGDVNFLSGLADRWAALWCASQRQEAVGVKEEMELAMLGREGRRPRRITVTTQPERLPSADRRRRCDGEEHRKGQEPPGETHRPHLRRDSIHWPKRR